ncbi:MAG: hypothetical protein GY835_08870 [bacterium]|nr:hypothetical protein [bacterium]
MASMPAGVAQLMSLMAGQEQTPPPDAVQPQGVPPLPAADLTGDTRMDTGATEMDQNQGDILMGDGSGAHADDTEIEGTKEA